jgi:hypothetical protein
MFIVLNVNIGINDLKVKIEKIKQKLALKKIVRATIQIKTRQSKVDTASGLLLNFTRMIEADMYPYGKSAIFKQGTEDDEAVEEIESLEDLDNVPTELSKQEQLDDSENLITDPKIVIRQTFIPVRKAQSIQSKSTSIKVDASKISDEEISQLVREKFATKQDKVKHIDMTFLGSSIEMSEYDNSEISFSPESNEKAMKFSPQYQEYLKAKIFNGNPNKNYRRKKTDIQNSKPLEFIAHKEIKNKSKLKMMTFTAETKIEIEKTAILPMVAEQLSAFDNRINSVNPIISAKDREIDAKIKSITTK